MLQETKVKLPAKFKFLFQPARYKASYGGRGSAKSHSFAQGLLIHGVNTTKRIVCTREIQASIKDSVKRLLEDKIEELGLRYFYRSTEAEIRGANGTSFTFAGLRSNPERITSREGIDICWVEEAHTVSQNSLDLLIPTVRKEGSELWFTWNPRHRSDPVDSMFRGDNKLVGDDVLVTKVDYRDNPWFPDVLRLELERDRRRDPDKYKHVWGGAYISVSEARVFKNWRIGEHYEFNPGLGTVFYLGADWGFANDPTVLIQVYIDEESKTIYVYREAYKIGCEIKDTPGLFQGEFEFEGCGGVPDCTDWEITADSSRPETISYMKNEGFNIVRAIKGPGSVEEGVKFLQNYDIVVNPDCRHTSDELTFYSYKTDRHTGKVLPILEDKHNHVIDALRYALEAYRRGDFWVI